VINEGPLLFRPELIEEESLLNYIYRLSIANKYPSMSYISDLLNIVRSNLYANSFSEIAINELSKLTLLSKQALFEKTAQYFESYFGELKFNVIQKSSLKCCPLCLRSDLKHKLNWIFNYVFVCPSHNVLLIDKCEGCNKSLDFPSLIKYKCTTCGFDIRNSTLTILESGSGIFLSQQFICELMEGEKGNFIMDINLKKYMELTYRSLILLDGLPSFIDFEGGKHQIYSLASKIGGTFSNHKLAFAFANVHWMYQNYPRNFYIVLDAFYQKQYYKRKYARKRFEELFYNGDFQIIKDSYDEFWKIKIREGNEQNNFLKKQGNQINVEIENLTKYAVRERFGLSRDEVRQLWEHRDLLIEIMRGGKSQLLLSKDAVDKLQTELDNWRFMITKKEAITILGIGEKMFHSIVSAGYIQIKHVSWNIYEYIDKRELDDFISKYVQNTLIKKGGIGLHEAIKKFQEFGLKIEMVLKLIDCKKLSPFTGKSNGTLGDIKFEKSELSKRLKYAYIDGKLMYSLKNLQEKLNMSKNTLHQMIDKGIIEPEKTVKTNGGKVRYYFLMSEMDKFIESHITVPDAAIEFNVSRDSLYRLIKRGKIESILEGTSSTHLLEKNQLIRVLKK
jgi:hypothetical protein